MITEKQKEGLKIGWRLSKTNHPCKGKHWKFSKEHNEKISLAKKGRKLSEAHRRSLSLTKIGKPIPHLHNEEIRKKISKALKGKKQPWSENEKHHEWKGKNAGYTAMHQWLKRHFGKADKCDNPECVYPRINANGKIMSEPKRFEWALIKGKKHDHKRDNYMRLCKSCHARYDLDLISINL